MNLRPKAVVVWKGDNYGMVAPKVLRKPVQNESRPVVSFEKQQPRCCHPTFVVHMVLHGQGDVRDSGANSDIKEDIAWLWHLRTQHVDVTMFTRRSAAVPKVVCKLTSCAQVGRFFGKATATGLPREEPKTECNINSKD